MAKRLLEGPAVTKGSALRGNMVVDAWRGTIRVKGWPRKRGKPKSAVTREQNEYFKSCLDLIAKMEPGFLLWCTERTKGTNIYPRDLAMQLLSGRGVSFVKPDGYVMFPEVFMNNVSTSLDSIAQDRGSMLVRDEQYWVGIAPDTAGLLWTSHGPGNMPGWAAPPATGPWDFAPPLAADFTLGSGEATNLVLTNDPKVGLMVDNLTSTITNCVRYATKPAPNHDWSVITRLKIPYAGASLPFGIIALDPVAHTYIMMGAMPSTTGFANRWGLTTGFVGGGPLGNAYIYEAWVRLDRIGTSIRSYVSCDGKSWQQIWDTRTFASIAPYNPTRVGLGVLQSNAGFKVGFSCPYWAQDFI